MINVPTPVEQSPVPEYTTVRDSATDDVLFQHPMVPMAEHIGRQYTIGFYTGEQFVQFLYQVDTIDTQSRTIYVSLNKVVSNDGTISIS